jgi:DNA-binding transcriptional regulator LsrR (DeoR family)
LHIGSNWTDDPHVRRTILATTPVRQAMDFLRRLDLAVVGIGAVSVHVPLVERGYVSARAMTSHRRAGARGEMLLQFFDAHGRPMPHLNRSVIGLALGELPGLPLVVAGVSGPPVKSEAVLAALRGRLIHVLITDVATARRVLERADEDTRPAAAGDRR